MLTAWGRSQFDFRSALIDEIALEGLDGITLEGLWKRLSERPHFTFPLDDYGKRYLWTLIKDSGQVDFFMLPVPRNPLVVFNRFDYVDPDVGMVLEPDDVPEDLYPHCLINDTARKIKGSCQYYKQRIDVTDNITNEMLNLEEVEKRWGMSLVLVATQSVRELALMGYNSDPLITMAPTRYCILERIGRSRYLGEVTQGKTSLQLVGDDAKTLFYHRKFLASNGLVTKQVYHQKQGKMNCSGSLLHLPRFYIERKSKTLILTHQVVKILKSRPNYTADYEEIRKELGIPNMLKKLFKTTEFQRFIRTDLKLLYRSLYPTASVKEWRHKGKDSEKTIRALQLIDPDLDENEIWMKDDDGEPELEPPKDVKPAQLLYDRSLLHQAFYVLDRAGTQGMSQMELSSTMGTNRLQSRAICRNLLKLGVVSTYLDDVGRQRVARYMSKRYLKESKLAIDFNTEKDKLFAQIKGKEKKLTLVPKTNESSKKKLVDQNESANKTTQPDDKVLLTKIAEKQTMPRNVKHKETSSMDATNLNPAKKQKMDEDFVDDLMPSTSGIETTESQMQMIGTEICNVEDSGPGIIEELQRLPNARKDAPAITYRILKRANYIIQAVQSNKVIDDLTKLMKMMNEEEEREGLLTKMDKKSLIRLLMKLNKDKYLKFIKITLKAGGREKILNFVCDLSITQDHPIIQSAIEQHKLKFFLVPKDKLPKPQPKDQPDTLDSNSNVNSELIVKSCEELKAMSSRLTNNTFEYDRSAGKKYGFSPKFIRLRTLHQFLFYIVYGYAGVEGLDQAQAVADIRAKGVELSEAEVAELPTIYLNEVSWKTFVPPLPQHAGWPQGWSIICDLLLRLPLSIFVRIINVTFNVPDLESYLNHPMRRHYLIKSLPSHMRNNLLVARKYIFSFHEIVSRLCFMGLAQFGQQRLKDKDQIFMYVNRRTSLLDTTSTCPGYHQVSDDIQYIKHDHEFTSCHDVDKYWYELWNICLNTQLGGRVCMNGQDIILEVLSMKQPMVNVVKPRTPEEAVLFDTGAVPGDHRGAAGLDSAIFSHLKRNWNWTNAHASPLNIETDIRLLGPQPENQRMARIASLKTQPVRFDVFLGSQAMKGASTTQMKVNLSSMPAEKKLPHNMHFSEVTRSPKAIAVRRRILPRKKSNIPRKPFYDEVDKKAQKSMTRWRVQWDEDEDNLLLLCKVASMFICPNHRKQHISYSIIRDILHADMPDSRTKTSRACQRRISYMMKNASTNNSLSLHLEEVKQDEYLVKNFENAVQDARAITKSPEELEKKICECYNELVSVLKKKFSKMNLIRNIPQSKFRSIIPDNLQELHTKYEVLNASSLKIKGKFQDVQNVVDICCATVNAVVHSTLCCITDKRSYMYQLFKIYQQYPDNLLRSVMAKIRTDQMVSARKTYAKMLHRTGNYLPVSSLPYQLSISYFYLLQTKYHFDVFYESHLMQQLILSYHKDIIAEDTEGATELIDIDLLCDRGMECVSVDGGAAACLVEWYLQGNLTLNLQIPENIVILDPRIEKKDEAYKKIVARYQEIMRSCKLTSSLPPTSALFTTPFFINDPSDPSHAGMNFKTDSLPSEQRAPTVTDNDAVPGPSGEAQTQMTNISLTVQKPAYSGETSTNEQPAAASDDPAMSKKCRFKMDRETMRRCVPKTPGEEWSDSDESSEEEAEADVPPTQVSPSVQYVIARAASRIALFLMRDSLASTNMGELQHAHDYFVVNSCQVFCKLHEERALDEATVAFQGFHYRPDTGNYVPVLQNLNEAHCTQSASATTKNTAGICKLKKEEILPILPEKTKQIVKDLESTLLVQDRLVSMEDVRELFEVSGASEEDWELACGLINWVKSKKEVGATMKELREKFMSTTMKGHLARLLNLLTTSGVLLRAGVTTTHYVHQNHRKPWLLQSYRLQRLAQERLMTQKAMVFNQRSKKRARLSKNYAEALFGGNASLLPLKKRVKRSMSLEDRMSPQPAQGETSVQEEIPHSSTTEVVNIQNDESLQEIDTHKEEDPCSVSEGNSLATEDNILECEKKGNIHSEIEPVSIESENTAPTLPCGNTVKSTTDQSNRVGQSTSNRCPTAAAHELSYRASKIDEVNDVMCESVVDTRKVEHKSILSQLLQEGTTVNTGGALDESTGVSGGKSILRRSTSDLNQVQRDANSIRAGGVVDGSLLDPGSELAEQRFSVGESRAEESVASSIIRDESNESAAEGNSLVGRRVRKAVRKRGTQHAVTINTSESVAKTGRDADFDKAVQEVEWSDTEMVYVVVRPWVRVDGSLNRRVLDRMLGSVLGYCLCQPCVSVKQAMERFSPALQPFQTRQLLEILQKFGCLKFQVVKKGWKTSLFSKVSPVWLEEADGTEDEAQMVIRPAVDAIMRLGTFIGDKAYKKDFLS